MSGGHYPSYNHIQPSQEFVAPRHRLPTIAPPRPTSPYNSTASISHAHTAPSSWINKRSFPSNYDNASFYPQSVSINFRPISRAHSNEESSPWTNPHLTISPSGGNVSHRDITQTEKMESISHGNMFLKDDVQQESIDLSSATHTAAATKSTNSSKFETSSVEGKNKDEPKEALISTLNGSDSNKSDKEISTLNKETVISVIASNPLKSTSLTNCQNSLKTSSNMSVCNISSDEPKNNTVNDDSAVKLDEYNKNLDSTDNVESVLETMFHSSSKSPIASGLSSVIVSTQSCKTARAESVEKILKSPSPEKCEDKSISPTKFNFADSNIINDHNLELENKEELDDLSKNENVSNNSNILNISLKKDHDFNFKNSEALNSSDSVSCSIKKVSKQPNISKISPDNNKIEQLVDELTNESSTNLKETCDQLIHEESNVCTIEELDNKEKAIVEENSNQFQNIEQKSAVANQLAVTTVGHDKSISIVSEKDLELKSTFNENSENSLIENGTIKEKQLSKNKTRDEEITYVEVESELEKMFAGIEDNEIRETDTDPLKSLPGESLTMKVESTHCGTSHTIVNDKYSQQTVESLNNFHAMTKVNKKKYSKKLKSSNTSKNFKEIKMKPSSSLKENTSVDNIITKRIPVIHVQGSKENPISAQIINSIKLEEDDFSDGKVAAKRKLGKSDQAAKKLAASYVVKNYDPGTSDASWICVFCKLCAHSPGIAGEPTGDLFGPYFINNPNHNVDDSESKRHSRKSNHFEQVKKKQKRSVSMDSSVSTEQKSLEIWAHENCIVWASGVHLIGSKLIGLEEAISEALQTICAHCSDNGASIGCKARNCKSCVHYSCALYSGWKLDTNTFISTCNIHRVPD